MEREVKSRFPHWSNAIQFGYGSPPLLHLFKKNCATFIQKELCCPVSMTRSLAPQSRHAYWHDFACIAQYEEVVVVLSFHIGI